MHNDMSILYLYFILGWGIKVLFLGLEGWNIGLKCVNVCWFGGDHACLQMRAYLNIYLITKHYIQISSNKTHITDRCEVRKLCYLPFDYINRRL